MKAEMLQARQTILKAVNEHRIKFNHYLLDNSYHGFTVPPLNMRAIQRAVNVARRWNIVDHDTLEKAGFNGKGRTGKGW